MNTTPSDLTGQAQGELNKSTSPSASRPRRRFIRQFDGQYQIPKEWDVIRVLLVEERPTGTGTNITRVYTCLCEEVDDDA